jgi:hypothetical protein
MLKDIQAHLLYPNPFTPFGIEFELTEAGFVTTKILDEKGEEVETVIEHKQFESGKHWIPVEFTKFAKGNHYYQMLVEIKGEKILETKKI